MWREASDEERWRVGNVYSNPTEISWAHHPDRQRGLGRPGITVGMAKLDLCYIRINVNPELNLLQFCIRRETGIDTHKHMEVGGGRMMNWGDKGEEDKQEDGDNGLHVYDVCPFYVQTEASDNTSDDSLPPLTRCSLTLWFWFFVVTSARVIKSHPQDNRPPVLRVNINYPIRQLASGDPWTREVQSIFKIISQ